MTAQCVLLLVLTASPVEADLLIKNVQIHDGTGEAPTIGDIAVLGDRIAAVGKFEVTGDPRVWDAAGCIAAPGFIDLHNHSDGPIVRPETALNENFLTQGVTTIVTGNCGGGRVDIEAYLRAVDELGAGTHVAHLIPQGSLRNRVMGSEKRPATPAELDAMREAVEQGMQAGAFGMSTGLIYVPSKYADTRELVQLAEVVGRHGGLYVSHMRNEGLQLLESIDETLSIGREAGVRVHISHFKASGKAAWGLAAEGIRLIEQARQAGQQVTADQYPYIASSTSLGAMVIPDEYRRWDRLEQVLADAERGPAVRAEIERQIEQRDGGGSLFIASFAPQAQWQGRDLQSLAKEQDRTVFDLVCEIQQRGGAQMVNFGMSEEEVRLIMQQQFVAVASDGGAKVRDETVPHPRNYGTFPRKIGEYALRRRLLPVEQAIRSASGLPADILGLTDRGYLKPGYAADVVVFDPETFIDTATFQQPHQYATGVRLLLVAGQVAVDEGKVTGVRAGRALRHTPR